LYETKYNPHVIEHAHCNNILWIRHWIID
jgi:hypothetical protein